MHVFVLHLGILWSIDPCIHHFPPFFPSDFLTSIVSLSSNLECSQLIMGNYWSCNYGRCLIDPWSLRWFEIPLLSMVFLYIIYHHPLTYFPSSMRMLLSLLHALVVGVDYNCRFSLSMLMTIIVFFVVWQMYEREYTGTSIAILFPLCDRMCFEV